jgi:sigma-B regulation protein RsbU (phosphoserine phosphatase)
MGRDTSCQITLTDMTVSRQHASIFQDEQGRFILQDLQSGNGTFVNGIRVETAVLCNNDVITVGDFTLNFFIDDFPKTQLKIVSDNDKISNIRDTIDVRNHSFTQIISSETDTIRIKKLMGHLQTVYDISNSVVKILDIEELLKKILSQLLDVFRGADQGFIILYNKEAKRLELKASQSKVKLNSNEVRISRTLIKEVVTNRHSILCTDASTDERFKGRASIVAMGINSILVVPLTHQDEFLGLIYLNSINQSNVFVKDDLELLTGISNQVVIAIINARMHKHLLKQQKMQLDLSYARQIQESFLPHKLPSVEGYEFDCRYKSYFEVGGDFYDLFTLSDGRIAILIGDVSGKGVSAALLMAKVTSELRMAIHSMVAPSQVMNYINNLISETFQDDRFITLLYTLLDPSKDELIVGNAGHMPLLLRRGRKVHEVGASSNPALGIIPGMEFSAQAVKLKKGDALFYFTDGISESQNKEGEMLGVDRIKKAMLSSKIYDSTCMCALVAREEKKFRGAEHPSDDLTMVEVIKTS